MEDWLLSNEGITVTSIDNPFEITNLEEVPLPNAPLVRVIAQVRFPPIMSIEDSKFFGHFQEALRSDYPLMKTEKRIAVNLLNPKDKREEAVWRMFDKSEEWRITLAPDFLAVETTNYKSRDNFFAEFNKALSCLTEYIKPTVCERIGVRYIDQIIGTEFKNISNLVRPEVLGIYQSSLKEHISSSLRQTVFSIDKDIKLSARWGVLATNQTYDPSSVAPKNEESWILDLDAFSDLKREFDHKQIADVAVRLATQAYHFFRWSVKDEFLETYGGQIK